MHLQVYVTSDWQLQLWLDWQVCTGAPRLGCVARLTCKPLDCRSWPAGTGNLTRHLLAAGALVTAVEKDYALSDRLTDEFAEVCELC